MEGERVYDKQTTDEIKEDIRSQMKSEESIDFKLDLEVSRPIFLKHHQLYLSFFFKKIIHHSLQCQVLTCPGQEKKNQKSK
jgi:hypothetical protein